MAAARFLAGTRLQWEPRAGSADDTTAVKQRASKTKFTCPSCGQKRQAQPRHEVAPGHAKPKAALMCRPCMEPMLSPPPDDIRQSP
jgi:hypothetical protein